MSSPVVTIDPRLPIVWQNPHAVQIGVDPARATLIDVDDRVLPLLHGLHRGVTVSGASLLAREAGLTVSETAIIMHALAPTFIAPEPRPLRPLRLRGDSAHLPHFAQVWRDLGHTVFDSLPLEDGGGNSSREEAVLIGNFVLDPALYRVCLQNDTVHTAVVFLDQSLVIGPRVTPGQGPCMHCVWRNASDRNPHHLAITSQLWGQRAATDTRELASLAAWHVRDLIHSPRRGAVLRIDGLTRVVSETREEPSAECACRGLDGPSRAGPELPENDSSGASQSPLLPVQP
ncbi:MAG: hypothetical protein ACJAV4_000140 [Pontimonas sp.]|jgi:hypothetical protein